MLGSIALGRRGQIAAVLSGIVALAPASVALAQIHTVSPGETLSAIAEQYGTTVTALARLNGIDDPNLIYSGETLSLDSDAAPPSRPAPELSTHAVVAGDTLSSISDQYAVSLTALADANNITDINYIYQGQVLTIPPRSAGLITAVQASGKVILRDAEQEYGLPRGLLLALAWQESGWNQAMVSDAGAIGITQIIPDTADWALQSLGSGATNWDRSAVDNARLGASILRYYIDQSGDIRVALASYYQGWQSVHNVGMFDETKAYVTNVLALQPQFQ